MGFLHSVARVDCLSAAAMRRLEEWPHICAGSAGAEDRTRLIDPLALYLIPLDRRSFFASFLALKGQTSFSNDDEKCYFLCYLFVGLDAEFIRFCTDNYQKLRQEYLYCTNILHHYFFFF